MLKTIHSKNLIYPLSIIILSFLSYLLNVSTAIYQCSLIFTSIALIVNFLTSEYNKIKALKALSLAAVVGFLMHSNLIYYIDGKVISGLVLASLSSVVISLYWSSTIYVKLSKKCSFFASNVLSVVSAAIIDGFIMGIFYFINNNLSYARVVDILIREISYKTFYGIAASVVIVGLLSLIKENKSITQ